MTEPGRVAVAIVFPEKLSHQLTDLTMEQFIAALAAGDSRWVRHAERIELVRPDGTRVAFTP